MSALLAASSMFGGADVSARSDRKRKVPGVANGVSRKLSSGSNLYKFLAIGGGSALGGALLTAAGIYFFGSSEKENTGLVLDLVKDIGDFLSVFDSSNITFDVSKVPEKGENGEEANDICVTVTLELNFNPYDKVAQGEAGKFLRERNGMNLYIGWNKVGATLPLSVFYSLGDIADECDCEVGCALTRGLPILLADKKLPKFDEKFIGEGKILRKFLVGLVRERLLFLYLRDKKGYNEKKIIPNNLAKICWGMWNVPEVKRVSTCCFDNLTEFKLED